MNDIDRAKEIFSLIDKVNAQEFDNTKKLLIFVLTFMDKYRKEEAKLPYHINLIDELHANENAHSRILAKLLQQKTPYGKHEILESFVRYLASQSVSFGNIHVKNPHITQETERIDLWIRDKDYAIIVENKIHWAGDQSEQLSRYINNTKGHGYREEQIYIIYLSPIDDKTPDEQTWGAYREKFKERYINLSYKYDILRWLTEEVLPNMRLKDKFLSSALEQYIDHLEGMFDLRTINKKMNMELQEFIRTELGLTGNPQDDIVILSEKQEDINKVNNQLQLLKDKAEKEIYRNWQEFLKTKYPKYQLVKEDRRAGLIIPIKDTTVRVSVSCDGRLFCQVDMDHKENENLPQGIEESVKRLLPLKNNNNQIWQYLPRDAYNDVYNLLLEVIEILVK